MKKLSSSGLRGWRGGEAMVPAAAVSYHHPKHDCGAAPPTPAICRLVTLLPCSIDRRREHVPPQHKNKLSLLKIFFCKQQGWGRGDVGQQVLLPLSFGLFPSTSNVQSPMGCQGGQTLFHWAPEPGEGLEGKVKGILPLRSLGRP